MIEDMPYPEELAYMRAAADAAHERKIDAARLRFLGAKSPAERRQWWEELRDLIARRSPAMVERMERLRGLR